MLFLLFDLLTSMGMFQVQVVGIDPIDCVLGASCEIGMDPTNANVASLENTIQSYLRVEDCSPILFPFWVVQLNVAVP